MTVSEQFLAERALAIGGSDVKHLVNLEPYGCTRQLWYDKKKVPADYPFTGNRLTRKGEALEESAAQEFEAGENRRLFTPMWHRHPACGQFAACHADRLQIDHNPDSVGVLQIKCPTAKNFYGIRRLPDPPHHAFLQLQWEMACWEATWGTVLLFCADSWTYAFWDRPAEPKLQGDLLKLGAFFWEQLDLAENPYPRHPDGHSACPSCPWRKTCKDLGPGFAEEQNVELMDPGAAPVVLDHSPQAAAAVEEFLRTRAVLKDAIVLHDIASEKLRACFPIEPGRSPRRTELRLAAPAGEAKMLFIKRRAYTPKPVGESSFWKLTVKPAKEEVDGEIEE